MKVFEKNYSNNATIAIDGYYIGNLNNPIRHLTENNIIEDVSHYRLIHIRISYDSIYFNELKINLTKKKEIFFYYLFIYLFKVN